MIKLTLKDACNVIGIKRKHTKTGSPNAVIGSVHEKKTFKNRLRPDKRMVIAAVAVVVLVAGIALWYHHQSVHTTAGNTKHALLVRAARYLSTDNTLSNLQLAPVTQQIRRQPSYGRDPDYLYVLLAYSVNTSDANHAETYYNELVQVYKPGRGYDETIRGVAKPPKDMKPLVDFLNTQKNDVQQHSFTVQEPAGL